MEHICLIQTTESGLMANDGTDDSKYLEETQRSVTQSAWSISKLKYSGQYECLKGCRKIHPDFELKGKSYSSCAVFSDSITGKLPEENKEI